MAYKPPTREQVRRHRVIRYMGCIICEGIPAIHHCETGAGGRKDHDKVLGLCYYHHQGVEGIHTIGREAWQEKYGTEQELMELTEKRLVQSKIR
jgi:hypothetical protein